MQEIYNNVVTISYFVFGMELICIEETHNNVVMIQTISFQKKIFESPLCYTVNKRVIIFFHQTITEASPLNNREIGRAHV